MTPTKPERRWLEAVGQRLRDLRKEKLGSRSQRELSRLAGISQPMVGQIERGETNTSLVVLARLANALEVEPGHFLQDDS